MEEISIDPPIISNFTENYPVNEEEDKRIEVEGRRVNHFTVY